MAATVRVKFVKKAPGWAYEVGDELHFAPEFAAQFAEYVEFLDPPAELKSGDGKVEYDGGEMVDRLNQTVADLRAQLKETETELVAANAQIAELREVLAGYTGAEAATKPAPVKTGEAASAESKPADQSTPAEASKPASEASGAPAAAQPAGSQPAAESWESTPVASLGIPASLKGLLMGAGLKTAGQVAEGLDDGTVLLIDGVGDAKAQSLRDVIAALRK